MTTRHLHTVASEIAHDLATSDREATAEHVVAVAREDALRLILLGQPGAAHYRLMRAVVSAGRILGAGS